MRASGRWVLGAMGLVVVSVALLALARDIQARHQRLETARAAVEVGVRLYRQGSFSAARAALGKALDADPGEWRTPFYLGVIEVHFKRYDAAIPYLEQALTLNPTEPKTMNALGVTYFKLGKLDLAKGYFVASLELDPANTDTKSLFETMGKLQRRAALAAAQE